MEIAVAIVGAGPSGIATSACLNLHKIHNIVIEREDYVPLEEKSLWLFEPSFGQGVLQPPHMPHPPTAPTFIIKQGFIHYIDD